MTKKRLATLYRNALKTSQVELERRSAIEALRQFDHLDLTLGEFVTDLKKDWRTFSQLSLADVLEALGKTGSGRRARLARPRKTRAEATRSTRRPPKRLTRDVSEKYSAAITAYLAENPGSKTPAVAGAVGLTSKQAASLLKKLRAGRVVTATGKAAGMRYTLGSKTKKRAARPPSRKKRAAKKRATKKRAKK